MTNSTILVDADILAYTAATATETILEWEPGYYTWYTDFEDTKDHLLNQVTAIKKHFGTTDVRLAVTHGENFRKTVLPSYKSNRAKLKKPLVLKPIREWMVQELGASQVAGLEADDIVGILATSGRYKDPIILSPDKDLRQIPGKLCKALGEPTETISEAEADHWFLTQVLTGDATDGYMGCPGIGKVKAEKILGPTPGHSEEYDVVGTYWSAIVETYEAQGLTESDALVQARVARILRASDWDMKNKEVKLWEPMK